MLDAFSRRLNLLIPVILNTAKGICGSFSAFSIVSIIIIESVMITSISGYLGLVLGIGILEAYGPSLDKYFITDPSVSTFLVAMATLALITAGFIAAWVPAKKASKIKPIIALRDE